MTDDKVEMSSNTSAEKPRYIYHYCAQWQEGSRILYYDGIALLAFTVDSMEHYHQLKELIQQSNNNRMPSNFTLLNLTLLGREAE